jgi:preprotein translocase subunit Sss1
MKKDKRYNSYEDNYSNIYKGNIILGVIIILIGSVGYGLYLFYEWLMY